MLAHKLALLFSLDLTKPTTELFGIGIQSTELTLPAHCVVYTPFPTSDRGNAQRNKNGFEV